MIQEGEGEKEEEDSPAIVPAWFLAESSRLIITGIVAKMMRSSEPVERRRRKTTMNSFMFMPL